MYWEVSVDSFIADLPDQGSLPLVIQPDPPWRRYELHRHCGGRGGRRSLSTKSPPPANVLRRHDGASAAHDAARGFRERPGVCRPRGIGRAAIVGETELSMSGISLAAHNEGAPVGGIVGSPHRPH